MSDTLEWYAKRGLLAASDEQAGCNQDRLRAGRALCRMFERGAQVPGQVSRYAPSIGKSTKQAGALTATEANVHRRLALEQVLNALPSRTRACVEQVCFYDERVGKPMMERLRCGLDALSQNITNCKNKC